MCHTPNFSHLEHPGYVLGYCKNHVSGIKLKCIGHVPKVLVTWTCFFFSEYAAYVIGTSECWVYNFFVIGMCMTHRNSNPSYWNELAGICLHSTPLCPIFLTESHWDWCFDKQKQNNIGIGFNTYLNMFFLIWCYMVQSQRTCFRGAGMSGWGLEPRFVSHQKLQRIWQKRPNSPTKKIE